MATTVQIPLEEYLETSYEHDREFVDGEVVERALPTFAHGKALISFGSILSKAGAERHWSVCGDTRMRVSPSRVRLPDVAVFQGKAPTEAVPSSPPLLIVEILSPSDSWSDVMKRLREFHDWGVRHVWLADPDARALYVYNGRDVKLASKLELAEYGISIAPDDVF